MRVKTWTDEQLAEAVATSTAWTQVAIKLGLSRANGSYLKLRSDRLGLEYSHFKSNRQNRAWTDQQLTEAVAASERWTQVASKLGLSQGSACRMSARADRLGLDYSHFVSGTPRTWTDEQLAEAVATSTTWTQVATKLGLSPGGGNFALHTRSDRLGLDYSHFQGNRRNRTWTDQQLTEAVATSTNWTQVVTKLGMAPKSGSYLKSWANRLGLDYGHIGGSWSRPRTWTDKQLTEAVAASMSWPQVLAKLGLTHDSRMLGRTRARADLLDLDYGHFRGHRRRAWADQELAEAVASSTSWTQVAVKLGLPPRGSDMAKWHADRMGLDYGHFASLVHGRRYPIDRESLALALANARSWGDVARQFGFRPDDGYRLRKRADRWGLDYPHLVSARGERQ